METFLIKALQLILSLSLLVVVHEFGHFLFARLFKIRVEKFYLFFNPWFSLFKFKPKGSDTEYGVGWLPLGGYVKIAGMIDESMDKEQMAKPAQAWEFRSKPAWQRMLVMVGGVLFNFILALFIFSMMLLAWGDTYISLKDAKNGMVFSEVVKEAGGFQDGDILISADGEELQLRDGVLSMNTLMSFVDAKEVRIERKGSEMTLSMPENFGDKVISSKKQPYTFYAPAVVDSVRAGTEAARIGLQKKDSITHVNGVAITSNYKLQQEVGAVAASLQEGETKEATITFKRDTAVLSSTINVGQEGVVGFVAKGFIPKAHTVEYGFFSSFPAGIKQGVSMLTAYVNQMKFVFTKEGAKSVGGFGAIGNMFPAEWNWFAFWTMTAFLSLALAFMNILPIPLLDGGHIMFLLYEMIAGRPPNEKFQEYAQTVGMVFLFGLLLYANGNDIIRMIFN